MRSSTMHAGQPQEAKLGMYDTDTIKIVHIYGTFQTSFMYSLRVNCMAECTIIVKDFESCSVSISRFSGA